MRGARRIQDPGAEAVLHIDIRFDEGQIVMNTMEQPLKWGRENRVWNPFKRGEDFHLIIRADGDKFDILANHKKIHEYPMRLPLRTIQYLTVIGDVTVEGVGWTGRSPMTLPIRTMFENGHLKIAYDVRSLRTHVSLRIAIDHDRSGRSFIVYGTPKGNFDVNLLARNDDILFHFKIVRNALIDRNWGEEERGIMFPFRKGALFDLQFLNTPDSIQVFFDGELICEFKHRTNNPASDYADLGIVGELDLNAIEFNIE
ncbi:unnamed protein product [Anisakis simplex]|uniref:Galectin n=1 Tax=Anisakis simplex TaxID=6269 RepID=A0A0M3IZ29_ANISI|nr:unnamed protein product [Anisakis simplex]